jgi:F-type H+-transporting ATPase subunit b
MAQTLQALAGILLKSIPTICLLLLLYFYLKAVLFGPLDKVLEQRRALTEGARRSASDSLTEAERKTQEYEAKMREARAEVYREQEELRKKWLADQAAQIEAAHQRTASSIKAAKERIAVEARAARQNLERTADALADEIASAVLSGHAGREQAG